MDAITGVLAVRTSSKLAAAHPCITQVTHGDFFFANNILLSAHTDSPC